VRDNGLSHNASVKGQCTPEGWGKCIKEFYDGFTITYGITG